MLQKIRDNTQGVINKVLVGLLIAVFALWGVDTIVGTFLVATPTLKVNGDEIFTQEIDSLYQRNFQEALAALGDNPDFSQIDQLALREAAVDELIQRKLLQQAATETGMGVSASIIDRRIAGNPDFQIDGKFNAERARLVLQGAGYSSSAYRAVLAEELMLNQLIVAYTGSGFATPDQMDRVTALSHQKRSFRYLAVPATPFLDTAEVSESDISGYYSERQQDFAQEEQAKVQYLELSKDALMGSVAVTEEQLQAAYQEEVAGFQAQTERRASHILWEATSDADVEAAMQAATAVKGRLDGGEDFAQLAAEFSDDPGSAQAGGDVGFTTGTSFVEPFEAALKALALNEVSAPVRTEFGVHLIKLTELNETAAEPFEFRRDALERALKEREVEALFTTKVEELKNLAFESVDLEQPATQMGLPLQTSDFFTRSIGSGIASSALVRTAAFASDVLDEGLNSEVISLDDRRSVVLRVLEHTEAQIRPLEQVRGEVELILRQQKAQEQATLLGQSFVAGMQSGSNIDGLLAERNLSWNQVDAVERVAVTLDPALTDRVFTMQRPEQGSRVAGFSMENGDYVIVELQSVTEGTAADLREGEAQNMRSFISQQAGANDFTAFATHLEERADIEGRETQLEVVDPLL